MQNALFAGSFEACEYSKPMFLNRKYRFGKSDRLLGATEWFEISPQHLLPLSLSLVLA